MQIASDLALALGFRPDDWWDGFEPAMVATDEYGAGWFWPEETFEGPSRIRTIEGIIACHMKQVVRLRRQHPTHDIGDDCA